VFLFSHLTHNSREEEEGALPLTDENLRCIVISTEMHGYREISEVSQRNRCQESFTDVGIAIKKRKC